MIPKAKTFKTQDVLAIAFAAYRANNGYIKDTYRFTENDPLFSNKDIVKFQLCPDYRPGDFKPIRTVEEDYEAVDVALKHFRRYTMEMLGETLSDFQKSIFENVVQEEVEYSKLGMLAYVPELVDREVRENALKKKLRTEYRDSMYLGESGDSVEGVCLILDSYYSSHYEKYSYTADYMGNIITFWIKFEIPVGERRKFKARVKEQTKHRLFSVNTTALNYVKVYKV
jgi:hypothetical protein